MKFRFSRPAARQQIVVLLLSICCMAGLPASAEQGKGQRGDPEMTTRGFNSSASKTMVKQSRRISNRKAASLVKQKYSSSRVLGVDLMDKGGAPIYRVKTLSPDGVVKTVYLDGETGEILK